MGKSFIIESTIENDVMIVKASGIASPREIIEGYSRALIKANSNQANKILLNVKEMAFNYDSFELFQMFKQLSSLIGSRKVARVISPSNHQHMLIEQMAEIKNVELKNFDCQEQALTWLAK